MRGIEGLLFRNQRGTTKIDVSQGMSNRCTIYQLKGSKFRSTDAKNLKEMRNI